jgi:hypothetical protein
MHKASAAAALPRLECSIVFLAASEGGRSSPLPPGALSGNGYRPHLVIGDPAQRHAILADGNRATEEYIGVAFQDGPAVPQVGMDMTCVLALMFYPHPMYDKLRPGVTFTVREGAKIVGYGRVRRWLD